MNDKYQLEDLLILMQRLRDPQDGCPWDREQNWQSIVPSTLEEAYEVADAIERHEYDSIRDELGDLVFQVVFYAQLAAEEGRFDMADIIDALVTKLLRRHPHVFPEGTLASRSKNNSQDESAVKARWEQIKAEERSAKGQVDLFDDVPLSLPALSRAKKLQKRAAGIGFDWTEIDLVVAKIREELSELEEAMATGNLQRKEAELGDLLFATVNLSRHLKIDPEAALRRAGIRFEQRLEHVGKQLRANGSSLEEASMDDLEEGWQRAKLELAGSSG